MFLSYKTLPQNLKSLKKVLNFKRCSLKHFTTFETTLETVQTKIDRQSQEFQVL